MFDMFDVKVLKQDLYILLTKISAFSFVITFLVVLYSWNLWCIERGSSQLVIGYPLDQKPSFFILFRSLETRP